MQDPSGRKNWSIEDDKVFTQSYIYITISQDPEVGTDQKNSTVW